MAKKPAKKSEEPEETLVDRSKDLLEKAKKDGKISQKEILKTIPETPENIDALDSLYEEMAEANITITATDASGKVLKDDWAEEEDDDEIAPIKDTKYLRRRCRRFSTTIFKRNW